MMMDITLMDITFISIIAIIAIAGILGMHGGIPMSCDEETTTKIEISKKKKSKKMETWVRPR